SLLWTSVLWRLYLSLVIPGLLLLVAYDNESPAVRSRAFWLGTGIGLTFVFSSFAFTLNILILYFQSHQMLVEETAAFHKQEV
ncbi:MAG: hypothetical protein AABZ83_00890, partial [candidate division NC10 bacterium]